MDTDLATWVGNPETQIGDAAFVTLGRYLAAKKSGEVPNPEDWEELQNDEDAMIALAEPADKVYATYGKLYKGFLKEIARKTFDHSQVTETTEAAEVAAALNYEVDRARRQGKPGTKGQLRDVLEKYEPWLNLPVNDTTISALSSWIRAIIKAEKKAAAAVEKLKAQAEELAKEVQADQDSNTMRRLILRELVQEGIISQDQMDKLVERLHLTD